MAALSDLSFLHDCSSLNRQPVKRAFLFNQSPRLAHFHDLALIHHDDDVVVENRRDSMSDSQHCGIIEVGPDRVLDIRVRLGVD